MNKKMDKKDVPLESEDSRIDYDHLDVSDIMGQIKKKVDAHPKVEPEFPINPFEFEKSGLPLSKTRRRLLKLMRPFSPIIKFLILPVHQELRETIHILDRTNKRIDVLDDEINRELKKTKEYIKLLHLDFNGVAELHCRRVAERMKKFCEKKYLSLLDRLQERPA